MRKRFLVKGKWRAATETASADFLREKSRDLGRENGGVCDGDGVGYAGKSNTAPFSRPKSLLFSHRKSADAVSVAARHFPLPKISCACSSNFSPLISARFAPL